MLFQTPDMHSVPRSLRGLKPQRVLFTPRRISSASQLSAQAAPSDPHGTTGQICNWVKSIGLEDIPEEIRTRTKYLILDGIGCALVGAKLPWSRTATSALLKMGGPGNCTLFGWDRVWISPLTSVGSPSFNILLAYRRQGVTPLDAALLNSTFIQGFELDDVHADAPWHANSIILPSLFAAVEHGGEEGSSRPVVNGQSFLLSTIVGFEIGSRVGHALHGPEMLTRGWHSVSEENDRLHDFRLRSTLPGRRVWSSCSGGGGFQVVRPSAGSDRRCDWTGLYSILWPDVSTIREHVEANAARVCCPQRSFLCTHGKGVLYWYRQGF